MLISPAQAASPSNELVYVANAENGPVTAYPAASGAIHPSRRVANPNWPNGFWDRRGVTLDASEHPTTGFADGLGIALSGSSS
jgi:hypothetical protein